MLLLRQKTRSKSDRWFEVFEKAADRLLAEYGRPKLGNFRNPVREILYIVLSAKTTDRLYRRAYRCLWSRFPKLSLIAKATERQILACVGCAGLGQKRAKQIKQIAGTLINDFGPCAEKGLRELQHHATYAYLVNLPGVGPKSAFCIMSMSLDADVFAVDINVQRIAERIGAIPRGLKHYQAQNRLPGMIPTGRSRDLHVGMVVHGRTICLTRNPRCGECVLLDLCRFGKRRVNA